MQNMHGSLYNGDTGALLCRFVVASMPLQGSVYNYYTFTTSFEVAGNHMSWQTCREVCKLVVHRRGHLGSDSQVLN